MFRQSMAFPLPIHASDTPPSQPPSESSRRQQQISASSPSPVKSHPLHNFPLSDLKWAMNHTNRLRKQSSRSPLREANHGKGNLVKEEVNEAASGSSSFELRPDKKKGSAFDRSEMKSTTADGKSKIFIRIRTKNNEETADLAATPVAADDAERISDGVGGEEEELDEFGPKTWNLRPRRPTPTKKRSIGGSSSGNAGKGQGTVRTEMIKSRSSVDAKMVTATERKEKKPRLMISLTKLEIDEDFYSLTGSKPSRRPKRRSKNLQRQLDVLFPGLWMGNVSSDAYKVSEHSSKV